MVITHTSTIPSEEVGIFAYKQTIEKKTVLMHTSTLHSEYQCIFAHYIVGIMVFMCTITFQSEKGSVDAH